jgi:Caspase domain
MFRRSLFTIFLSLLLFRADSASALEGANQFVAYRAEQENIFMRAWRVVIGKPKARNILLTVGIANYTNLRDDLKLPWVNADLRQLQKLFVDTQGFDEVIILKDGQFDEFNLKYLLTEYLPEQFKAAPGSRFVFAFSGHGFTREQDQEGFLLKGNAINLRDDKNSISFSSLREWFDSIVQSAHQSLILINSCESGSFFAPARLGRDLPDDVNHPGHWVIAATRDSQSALAGPRADITKGTLFYEVLYEGIVEKKAARTRSDKYITYWDLVDYMKTQIALRSDRSMTPTPGGLVRAGWSGAFVFSPATTCRARKPNECLKTGPRWAKSASFGGKCLIF